MSDAVRRSLRHYLAGDGIEIGALHHPLDLSGLPISRVRYVDRLPVAELRAQYPELAAHDLVPLDIVDDGRTLATIPDASLDFIIANHLIEHCDDPIGAISRWLAKLRPGGVLFIAAPDRTNPIDARRPVTPLAHLIADHTDGEAVRAARNIAHYYEMVESAWQGPNPAEAERMIAMDYSIHFHVFTLDSFRAMLVHMRDALAAPLEIADFAPPEGDDGEFFFILRRRGPTAGERAYDDLAAWAAGLETDARAVRSRTRLQRAMGRLFRL